MLFRSAAARAELTSALLVHMPHVPNALRERIGGVCDGYPFYMEEMVKMLIDEGVIETDADTWRVNLDRLHASQLPHTLTGVLQARLDSLARAEKLALQQASVVGFVFWDEAIAAIEPRSREALPALAQRELIVRNAQAGWDGVAEYAFKHQILHQVAYETVLKRERRAYHAQAAGWLAGLSGARAGDFLGLTGEHFEQAGMTQRACEFFAQAAERAATRHSHAAALGWAARALALLDRAGEAVPADRAAAGEPSKSLLLRWRLLDQTERLFDSLGRRAEQRKTIDALNDVANALDDSGKRGEVAWRRSTLAMRTGEFPFMAATAREAIAHAKSADDHSLGLRAQQRLATALGFLGELETARSLAHEGLAGARGLGLRRVEALFLNTLSLIANWLDDPVQTLELCQQTLEASRALGDRTLEATTLCNLGLAWLGLGERAQAQVALDAGMALTRAVGHSATEASLLINRSLLTLWQGDAALASAQAQAALAITLETKSTSVEGEAWRALGYAELALGRHAAAATAFEHVRALAPVSKPGLVFDAAAGLAQVALASGDLAAAQRAVEPVLAHLASSGTLDMALAQRSIEWACHQVLVAAGDVRAFEILGSAHAELQAKAATITPPALRESFLHAIPEHHKIVAAWTAHQAA